MRAGAENVSLGPGHTQSESQHLLYTRESGQPHHPWPAPAQLPDGCLVGPPDASDVWKEKGTGGG